MKKWRKERNLQQPRIIISGGGTGGHVFPAIAIAGAIRAQYPDAQFLFVGAIGKIEMEKVPAAGYDIVGLDIRGLQRNLSLANLKFPIRLIKSCWKARQIIKEFKPDVAVGVGGYASGPLLFMAAQLNIPCLIQEQNSYPGITNKILSSAAKKICVAYEGMDKYFEQSKLLLTGNPVRSQLVKMDVKRSDALAHFGLAENKKTVLIIGGSLGARTLNTSVLKDLNLLVAQDIQVIWQTGKLYYSTIVENVGSKLPSGVRIFEFISNMEMAYAAADVIISRAGAGTISELCLLAKPVILVPSPNVAEDHQTKNAMALVKKSAAILISDANASTTLIKTCIDLLNDESQIKSLGNNISQLAITDAAEKIATEVIKLIK